MGAPIIIKTILLIVFGYLLGSIPAAYVAGRWLRGVDIRRYGSGTVSGSMVWDHVAPWAVIPVGLFDVAKAWLPAWIGISLGLGVPISAAAGLAAAVGHNWPIFLRFTGGRGLGCFLGVWLAIYPWGAAWMLGILAVGWLLGDSAPWALAGIGTLPLFAGWMGGLPTVGPIALAMLLITLAKRLEANRRPLPEAGPERTRVLLRRLFLDRDIGSHRDWIRREPDDR